MMNKEQIAKIFKNKNNLLILVIFIIGVVLMIISGGHISEKEKKADAPEMQISEEERLSDILSKIEGAGSVSVMITYYSGVEKTLAYETKTASRETGSEVSEDRKAVMTDGEPMVVKEVNPRVKGVIVTAQGADSASVKTALSEAVMAALDVPAHRICIFKKEEE